MFDKIDSETLELDDTSFDLHVNSTLPWLLQFYSKSVRPICTAFRFPPVLAIAMSLRFVLSVGQPQSVSGTPNRTRFLLGSSRHGESNLAVAP